MKKEPWQKTDLSIVPDLLGPQSIQAVKVRKWRIVFKDSNCELFRRLRFDTKQAAMKFYREQRRKARKAMREENKKSIYYG